ncbi:hypothetical protein [Candidatus Ichthyocystis hellenicum]|uniref:hypothetical protein n=1 Tax=Candidatus Ichthyocystis hellenicum TaxID=1561003 RepID=UPI000B8A1A1F|nr:hypothetical protein [Candidatus Ichthyocystis hellenicum]
MLLSDINERCSNCDDDYDVCIVNHADLSGSELFSNQGINLSKTPTMNLDDNLIELVEASPEDLESPEMAVYLGTSFTQLSEFVAYQEFFAESSLNDMFLKIFYIVLLLLIILILVSTLMSVLISIYWLILTSCLLVVAIAFFTIVAVSKMR